MEFLLTLLSNLFSKSATFNSQHTTEFPPVDINKRKADKVKEIQPLKVLWLHPEMRQYGCLGCD